MKHSRLAAFEAGRILFDKGGEPLGAYFILNGEVQTGPDELTDPIQRLLRTIHKGELNKYVEMLKKETYGRGSLIGMDDVLFGEARPNQMIVTGQYSNYVLLLLYIEQLVV